MILIVSKKSKIEKLKIKPKLLKNAWVLVNLGKT